MKITIISSFYNVDDTLKEDWNKLLANSYTNSIFLTWEWISGWWKIYHGDKNLLVICARNDENNIVGIAPLFLHKSEYYGVKVNEISFIGDNSSDRQDFIVHRNYPHVYKRLIDEISENNNWDIMRLEQIPEFSPLRDCVSQKVKIEAEHASSLPYIKINKTWDKYYKCLSKKFKKDLRNKYNVLRRDGEWDLEILEGNINAEKEIKKIVGVELNSKKKSKDYALFSDNGAVRFHKTFINTSNKKNWVKIYYIKKNEKIISYLMGYQYNESFCAYNIAYLPEYAKASPGKIILNEAIKESHNKKINEFDFLRGDTYIKKLWTHTERPNYRFVIFNKNLKASLLRFAVFYARPFIKKHIKK